MYRLRTNSEWLKKAAEREEGFDVSAGKDIFANKPNEGTSRNRGIMLLAWDTSPSSSDVGANIHENCLAEFDKLQSIYELASYLQSFAFSCAGDQKTVGRVVRRTLLLALSESECGEMVSRNRELLRYKLLHELLTYASSPDETEDFEEIDFQRFRLGVEQVMDNINLQNLRNQVTKTLRNEDFRINLEGDDTDARECYRPTGVDVCAQTELPIPGALNRCASNFVFLAQCYVSKVGQFSVFQREDDKTRTENQCVLRAIDDDSAEIPDAGNYFPRLHFLNACTSSLEFNLVDGVVCPNESLHECVTTLRYALPSAIYHHVASNMNLAPEKRNPSVFCPILVSDSPLYVIDRTASAQEINAAKSLSDVAKEVPYLALYSAYEPDFELFCRGIFRPLHPWRKGWVAPDELDIRRRYNTDSSSLAYALAEGTTEYLNHFFTRFVICHRERLDSLVVQLKDAAIQRLMLSL